MTDASLHLPGRLWDTEKTLRAMLGLMIGLSCVSFIEPSPYDVLFAILIPMMAVNGIRITRSVIVFYFLTFATVAPEVLSLVPHLGQSISDYSLTPGLFTFFTVYLNASALIYALVFSKHTGERIEIFLKGYAFSCVFASIWGILSYANVGGIGDFEPVTGRIAGPFKDPNVYGSYCVMGALYFMQSIMIGKRGLLPIKIGALLLVLFGGVFLSFSRGSWGALVVTTAIMGVSTFATADDRAMRRKILSTVAACIALAVVGLGVLMSNSTIRETVLDRAKVEQEYDGGETGRFGNQKRSIPLLLERPLGFGPLLFRERYDLDPHNSYVGAFANGGWLGGFGFILLVISTTFVGFRLALTRSPYIRQAQVVMPALFGFFVQAFQIDIDHWRAVFIMLGAIWGMESGRARWAARQPVSPKHARRTALPPRAEPSPARFSAN